jgi:2-oxoglutarate dehydrogenase complex dehydrogenase (E1) component-like enzyme
VSNTLLGLQTAAAAAGVALHLLLLLLVGIGSPVQCKELCRLPAEPAAGFKVGLLWRSTLAMLLLCCRARRARRQRDIVLVRLEQISPFPHDLLMNVVQQYRQAELVWCQEEPKNMGAWGYVQPRLLTALKHCGSTTDFYGSSSSSRLTEVDCAAAAEAAYWAQRGVKYVGRAAAASTATASFSIHQKELAEIIDAALTVA